MLIVSKMFIGMVRWLQTGDRTIVMGRCRPCHEHEGEQEHLMDLTPTRPLKVRMGQSIVNGAAYLKWVCTKQRGEEAKYGNLNLDGRIYSTNQEIEKDEQYLCDSSRDAYPPHHPHMQRKDWRTTARVLAGFIILGEKRWEIKGLMHTRSSSASSFYVSEAATEQHQEKITETIIDL